MSKKITYTAKQIADMLKQFSPTDEQVKIIEHPVGAPLLVIAGAGAGKTEVMSAKVVYLVANEIVEPEEILALTFTNKAAGELRERIKHRLNKLNYTLGKLNPVEQRKNSYYEKEYSRPHTSTYNAFASTIIKEFGYKIGVSPLSKLITDAQIWQIIYEIVSNYKGDIVGDLPINSVVENVVALRGQLQDHDLQTLQAQVQLEKLADELEENAVSRGKPKVSDEVAKIVESLRVRASYMPIVQEYFDYKRRNDMLDYSDQVWLAKKIIQQYPQVAQHYRNKYKVILLDEYQDTSVSQIELLSDIFRDCTVVAVGDPKQAIYGWRGASSGAISGFAKDFCEQTKAVELNLSVSWRNDKAILSFANALSEQMDKLSLNKSVTLPTLMPCDRAGAGRIEIIRTVTQTEQAEKIAEYIKNQPKGCSIAVICRGYASFRPVYDTLKAQGIPAQMLGLDGLLLDDIVRDLLAFLHVSVNSDNNIHLMRLMCMLNIGARDMVAYNTWVKKLSKKHVGDANAFGIIDCLEMLPEDFASCDLEYLQLDISELGFSRLKYLRECLRKIRANAHLPLVEQVKSAIKICGLDIHSQVIADGEHEIYLKSLVKVAAGFSSERDDDSLKVFLDWLEVAQEENESFKVELPSAKSDQVQILTMHASKGLEWDIVIVPDLLEDVLPKSGKRSMSSAKGFNTEIPLEVSTNAWLTSKKELPYTMRKDKQYLPQFSLTAYKDEKTSAKYIKSYKLELGDYRLSEDLRLAYVAFTRARSQLLLSASVFVNSPTPRYMSRYAELAVQMGYEHSDYLSNEQVAQDYEELLQDYNKSQVLLKYWPKLDYERISYDYYLGQGFSVENQQIRWGDYQLDQEYQVLNQCEEVTLEELYQRYPEHKEILTELELLLAERDNVVEFQRNIELPTRIATTAAVRKFADIQNYVQQMRRPVPGQPLNLARMGELFHKWVELKQWNTGALFELEDISAGPVLTPAEQEKIAQWKENFLNMEDILEKEFIEQEQQYELPVVFEIDGKTYKETYICRIDAVLQDKDGNYIVVDWKTGSSPKGKKREELALQLGLYRLVWASNHKVDLSRVKACFVYVNSNEIVYLHEIFKDDFTMDTLRQKLVEIYTRTNKQD